MFIQLTSVDGSPVTVRVSSIEMVCISATPGCIDIGLASGNGLTVYAGEGLTALEEAGIVLDINTMH